jgi:predicted nucleic acid-binding protein
MSESPRKLYWDSSCFICLLNDAGYERNRRIVIEDILENAERGVVEIWTSTYTIVEVIRPKRHGSAPMPAWAIRAMELVEKEFPQASLDMETLWKRYQANDPSTKLTPEQIDKIQAMFEWSFIKLIDLNQLVADEAVKLCRDYGLKTADAIHAASAKSMRGEKVLQRYDRDFDKVRHLIPVEEPQQISPQASLFAAAPKPEDFKPVETESEMQLGTHEIPAALLSSGEQIEESEAETPKVADEGDLGKSGS